jgi:hypothetical protein
VTISSLIMPKDNRNTLAAFDDLLASLEEMVVDDELNGLLLLFLFCARQVFN